MIRTAWLGVLLIFGVAVFPSIGKDAHSQPKEEKAPSFKLKLLNGGAFNSLELTGKVAVLKFVASY